MCVILRISAQQETCFETYRSCVIVSDEPFPVGIPVVLEGPTWQIRDHQGQGMIVAEQQIDDNVINPDDMDDGTHQWYYVIVNLEDVHPV